MYIELAIAGHVIRTNPRAPMKINKDFRFDDKNEDLW